MIICPKCGKVNKYGIKEFYHRTGIFDERGECIDTTEDVGDKYGQPRCLECGRMVKFFKDPDCVGGLRSMRWGKWEGGGKG